MKRVVSIMITLILAMLVLGGCAATPPAESEGQKAIQQQAKSHNIDIVSFKKTDGKTGTNNGIATYEMFYEVSAKGLVHKGQNITGKGSIVFEKRENGWVSVAVKGLPTDEMTYKEEMEAGQKSLENLAKKYKDKTK